VLDLDALLAEVEVPRGSRKVAPLDDLLLQVQGDPLSEQLRRCALAVADKLVSQGGVSQSVATRRAFAICTKSLQRTGYLLPGTNQPTAKGIAAALGKLADPQADRKHRQYEQMLVRSRKPAALLDGWLAEVEGRRGAANFLPLPGSRNVDLSKRLQPLRDAMEEIFRCDTAYGDCHPAAPSAGHCMLASMVVQDLFGGQIVGGTVKNIPHYWNRIGEHDVDITGDQFGFAEVRIKKGPLHKGAVFGRAPQETLDQPYNAEVTRLHKRFVKRLIGVLRKGGEKQWASQLAGRSQAKAA